MGAGLPASVELGADEPHLGPDVGRVQPERHHDKWPHDRRGDATEVSVARADTSLRFELGRQTGQVQHDERWHGQPFR